MDRVKFLIVDDNEGFRARVAEFLIAKFDTALVEEASNGQQAVRKAKMFRPSIVLMDVKMPGESGLEATRRLKAEVPEARVIIVSRFDIDEYKRAAEASGACGYVVKRSLVEELSPAIENALKRANGRSL